MIEIAVSRIRAVTQWTRQQLVVAGRMDVDVAVQVVEEQERKSESQQSVVVTDSK
jgi:hypothetical protein